MPHLLMQTKFPAAQTSAEINFYGVVDPKTMQAVEDATREAMLTTVHPPGQTEVCQHPQASNVTQFVVNLPDSWDCRRTLQNVLRVLWLDIFERSGWHVVSACDASQAVGSPSLPGGSFHGECTNFMLYRPAPSTSTFAKRVENGKAHADLSHAAGVVSSTLCEDGLKRNGDVDEWASSKRSHGLPLPEVVQRLLRENNVLRWDPVDRSYIVLDGAKFEDRFNHLRKTRQKHKDGTVERPFSRMHNFYILERGDKWAKTGTVFRPKKPSYAPTGYQKDLGDMAFATNRTKAAPPAACTENAAQHQGLALLSSVLPSVGVSLDAGGDGGSGGSGSFSPVAAADYRMLSALMAARGH